MAGADRMTTEEVVRRVPLDEGADLVREAGKAVVAELMVAIPAATARDARYLHALAS